MCFLHLEFEMFSSRCLNQSSMFIFSSRLEAKTVLKGQVIHESVLLFFRR